MKKILRITWDSLKELGAGIFQFLAYLGLIAAIVVTVSSCQARADKETSRAYLMVLDRIDQLEEKIDDQEYRIDDLRDEIANRMEEMQTDQNIRAEELADETEWILDRLNEAEESLAETAGTTEYILELIEEYHPE